MEMRPTGKPGLYLAVLAALAANFTLPVPAFAQACGLPFPSRTAIDFDRLIADRGITEIKIVARRPAAPRQH
jgi:hypothetical protein